MFTVWDNGLTTWDNQTTIWDYVPDGFSRVILVCPESRNYVLYTQSRVKPVASQSRTLLFEALDRIFELKPKKRTLELSPDLYKVTCR